MSERWIGRSVKRVEDGRLLTGRGTCIDDDSPVPNARLSVADLSGVRRPG